MIEKTLVQVSPTNVHIILLLAHSVYMFMWAAEQTEAKRHTTLSDNPRPKRIDR